MSLTPGFAPDAFRRIRASHLGPDQADPYIVLGVEHSASEEEIKHTYRLLVRENQTQTIFPRARQDIASGPAIEDRLGPRVHRQPR